MRTKWTAVLVPTNDPVFGGLREVNLVHPNLLKMDRNELYLLLLRSKKFNQDHKGYDLIDLY